MSPTKKEQIRLALLLSFILFIGLNCTALTIEASIPLEDINMENNRRTLEQEVFDTQYLKLFFQPIDFEDTSKFEKEINRQASFLKDVYPVSNQTLVVHNTKSAHKTCKGISFLECEFLEHVFTHIYLENLLALSTGNYVVGIAPEDWFEDNYGVPLEGGILSPLLPVAIVEIGNKQATSHEIGHMFGLCDEYETRSGSCPNQHENSNIVNGIRVKENQIEEITNAWCIMSGSKHEKYWIHSEDYNHLISKLKVPPIPLSFAETSSQSLIVSGTADKNGSIALSDLYIIDTSQESELPIGPYSLKLLDATETILYDQNFDVSFTLLSDPPIDLNTSGFVFTVPFPAGTNKIQIDFNGQTRAVKYVSANPPTVSFTTPSGGEEWSGTETISWTSSDVDSDTLSFVLQYSRDEGLTWNPLAIDMNEESYELNTGYLTPGENYKLKVIVTDGVLTGENISNTFTIRNPDIDVQPWKIELGELDQRDIVSKDVNLGNTGNANLEITSYTAPANVSITGPTPPLTLPPGQGIITHIEFDSTDLNGEIDQNIHFDSNDPNEPQKHLFIEAKIIPPEPWPGQIHLEEMPSYEKEHAHYSGAATAQMILNHTRNSVGYTTLSQDQIYNYAHHFNDQNNHALLDFDASAMDTALGHYDPYDSIITDQYDNHDNDNDGNPLQGYNYTIDTYDNIEEYMLDICHWMAYPVTRQTWWNHNELVAEPNTPAAIPLYGDYTHWVAVNGFVSTENPTPNPNNPWETQETIIHGFWLTDPNTNGIGQHTYITATDANNLYFTPMNTNDQHNGKYLQIAEPPTKPPQMRTANTSTLLKNKPKATIAKPKPMPQNLELVVFGRV